MVSSIVLCEHGAEVGYKVHDPVWDNEAQTMTQHIEVCECHACLFALGVRVLYAPPARLQ